MYIFSFFNKIFTNIANLTNCKKFEYKTNKQRCLQTVMLNLCNIIRTQICNYIKYESFRLKHV